MEELQPWPEGWMDERVEMAFIAGHERSAGELVAVLRALGLRVPRELYLALVLDDCLERMRAGERDVDRLVSLYPEEASEIRPLLEIAALLWMQSEAARESPPEP